MKNKIYDCVTFYNENLQVKLRFNILKNYVDKFVICESKFDHQGRPKKLNFKIQEFEEFKDKIIYLILDKQFPNTTNPWAAQAYQREFLLEGLVGIDQDDYVMFSDPDEIPKPELLVNFKLKKKYGIFMQKMFSYKLNLFNQYESPWEGTRIARKKDLKSIDYLRQKIIIKNLKYSFLRFDKEKNIEIFKDGGWHFNYLLNPEAISIKLKTFAHTEFNNEKYTDIKEIKYNVDNFYDLFQRGHVYKKIELNRTFPKYILENKENLIEWIV
jgi:beta-1,4-mannosyl-glycoprotein beta-1,4-N-acetylglucosaminyltransferase